MEKKQVRKINIHSQRIYLITEKLKAINKGKESKDYGKQLQEVLERGLNYTKRKSKEE